MTAPSVDYDAILRRGTPVEKQDPEQEQDLPDEYNSILRRGTLVGGPAYEQQQQEAAAAQEKEKALASTPVGIAKNFGGVTGNVMANALDVVPQAPRGIIKGEVGGYGLVRFGAQSIKNMYQDLKDTVFEDPSKEDPERVSVTMPPASELEKELLDKYGLTNLEPQTPAGNIAEKISTAVTETASTGASATVVKAVGLARGIGASLKEMGAPDWLETTVSLVGPFFGAIKKGLTAGFKRIGKAWNYEAQQEAAKRRAADLTNRQMKIALYRESVVPGAEASTAEELSQINREEAALAAESRARDISFGRAKTTVGAPEEALAGAEKAKAEAEKLAVINKNIIDQQQELRLKNKEYLSASYDKKKGAEQYENLHSKNMLRSVSPLEIDKADVSEAVKKELVYNHEKERGAAATEMDRATAVIGGETATVTPLEEVANRELVKFRSVGVSEKGATPIETAIEDFITFLGVNKGTVRISDLIDQKQKMYSIINYAGLDPTKRQAADRALKAISGVIDNHIRTTLRRSENYTALSAYSAGNGRWSNYVKDWHDPHVVDAMNMAKGGTHNYSNAEIYSAVKPRIKTGWVSDMVDRSAIEGMTENVTEKTLRDTNYIRRQMNPEHSKVAKEIIDAKTPGLGADTLYAKKRSVLMEFGNYMETGEHPKRILSMMRDPKEYSIVKRAAWETGNGKAIMDHLHEIATEDILTQISTPEGILDPKKINTFVSDRANKFLWNTAVPTETKKSIMTTLNEHKDLSRKVDRVVKEVEEAQAVVDKVKGAVTKEEKAQTEFKKHYTRRMKELESKRESSTKFREQQKANVAKYEEQQLGELSKEHAEEIAALERDAQNAPKMGAVQILGAVGLSHISPKLATMSIARGIYLLGKQPVAKAYNEFISAVRSNDTAKTAAKFIILDETIKKAQED